MADAYFENNWRDCNEQEQAVLRSLASQQAGDLTLAERQSAWLSLSRKELVEQHGAQWRFTVELFRQWVKREKTAELPALAPATERYDDEFVSVFHAQGAAPPFPRP